MLRAEVIDLRDGAAVVDTAIIAPVVNAHDRLADRKRELLGRLPGRSRRPCGASDWNDWSADVLAIRPAEPDEAWNALARLTIKGPVTLPAGFQGFVFPGELTVGSAEFRKGADFSGCVFNGVANFVSDTPIALADGTTGRLGATFSKSVSFAGAVFRSNSDFTEVQFAPSVSFAGCCFTGPVRFERTWFRRNADFTGARFLDAASFAGAEFAGAGQADATTFADSSFAGEARFDEAVFFGSKSSAALVVFDRAVFQQLALFERCRFGDDRDNITRMVEFSLTEACFRGGAHFAGAMFAGDLTLLQAVTFDRGADFTGAVFGGALDLSGALISVPARQLLGFHDATVKGALNLTGLRLMSRIEFDRSIIHGRFDASGFEFGDAGSPPESAHSFAGVQFLAEVDLKRSRAHGDIRFTGARFARHANMAGAQIMGKCAFDEVVFDDLADFRNAELLGDVDFSSTAFNRRVEFAGAVFGRKPVLFKTGHDRFDAARFEGTKFGEFANFDNARFHGDVVFRRIAAPVALTMDQAEFSSAVPSFSQVNFRFAPAVGRFRWGDGGSLDVARVVINATRGQGDDAHREMALRLRTLQRLAEDERNLSLAQRFSALALRVDPEPRLGARLFNRVRRFLIGDGDRVLRPLVMLLLATLVLFPIIFAWPYFPPLQGQGVDALGSFRAAIFDRTCPSGSGSPFLSALHASLRNALFAIPDLDDRAKQVTECLYGDKAATIATRWQALVPLFQSILSAILIFAIGTAVRNRLRIR